MRQVFQDMLSCGFDRDISGWHIELQWSFRSFQSATIGRQCLLQEDVFADCNGSITPNSDELQSEWDDIHCLDDGISPQASKALEAQCDLVPVESESANAAKYCKDIVGDAKFEEFLSETAGKIVKEMPMKAYRCSPEEVASEFMTQCAFEVASGLRVIESSHYDGENKPNEESSASFTGKCHRLDEEIVPEAQSIPPPTQSSQPHHVPTCWFRQWVLESPLSFWYLAWGT